LIEIVACEVHPAAQADTVKDSLARRHDGSGSRLIPQTAARFLKVDFFSERVMPSLVCDQKGARPNTHHVKNSVRRTPEWIGDFIVLLLREIFDHTLLWNMNAPIGMAFVRGA